MSQDLGFVVRANTSDLLAKMVAAGDVTETQAKRMQRSLSSIDNNLKAIAKSQTAANDGVAGIKASSHAMEEFGFHTAGAKRELLVLAHEASQGNWKRFAWSLLVIGERTNAMGVIMSAAGLAVGATVAVVGSFAVAAAMGAHQSEEFRKSLILTGNAAGMTSSSFDEMARAVAAATGGSNGSAREALQALVSTGRMGQQAIEGATRATLLMEQLTGQSADKIVCDFAKMGDGVAQWAEKHNEQYHYLSVSQFEYIKRLEDQGKVEQAEVENLRLLNDHMSAVHTNLGTLARAWQSITDAAKNAWDAMLNIGRSETLQQELDHVQTRLANLQYSLGRAMQVGADANQIHIIEKQIAAYRDKEAAIQESMRMEQRAADLQAQNAAANEKGIKAIMHPAKTLGASKAPDDSWNRFLSGMKTYAEESAQMLATGAKLSAADTWAIQQKARLTDEIKRLGVVAVEVGKQMIDAEAAQRTQAEKLLATRAAAAAAEKKHLADEIAQRKKAAEMEAEMQKLLVKLGVVPASAQPPKSMGTDMQTAATKYLQGLPDQAKMAENFVVGSFSRMNDALVKFTETGKLSFASLFGFMANEFIKDAILRAQRTVLLDKAGGFTMNSPIGKLLNGMFGGSGASGSSSGSNLISTVFSAMSGFFGGSHANGLDYVPYDGYQAILHKGERVQTAMQRDQSTAGNSQHFDFSGQVLNVGSNVSRPEIAAALQVSQQQTIEQVRRLTRQGRFA